MITDTLTLTAFLLARIDEDEAVAMRLGADGTQRSTDLLLDDEYPQLIISAGRVLAECAAKRDAIDAAWSALVQIDGEWGENLGQSGLEAINDHPRAVTALARIYADHPDFNPDWA